VNGLANHATEFFIEPGELDDVPSPVLVVFREQVKSNLRRMIEIAGGAARLCPHCKTHKMAEIVRLELDRGITRHKCATLAEAEMLASVGAGDILLAYNAVGPNVARLVELVRRHPHVSWSTTVDHEGPLTALAAAAAAAGQRVGILLDLNVGMNRTGIRPGESAHGLYRLAARLAGARPAGLHVYDGHHRQQDLAERRAAVEETWRQAAAFRDQLLADGLPVPRVVAGGTGSFPIYAAQDEPALQLSPGTIVFHDAGYGEQFPDLDFKPAAAVLTRVVSRPGAKLATLDVGHKAIAGDPPAGRRVWLPALPDAREVVHSEEHLVIESAAATSLSPGDWLLAVPRHICPTTALYESAVVIADGRVAGRWAVTARDRRLSFE